MKKAGFGPRGCPFIVNYLVQLSWTAAGASHGGGEIHQLPYSEAFGGSATW